MNLKQAGVKACLSTFLTLPAERTASPVGVSEAQETDTRRRDCYLALLLLEVPSFAQSVRERSTTSKVIFEIELSDTGILGNAKDSGWPVHKYL